MAKAENSPQEDTIKWAIRYVVIPVTVAVTAGYFALAVVDRQFEHQTRRSGDVSYDGIFATLTAVAANSQPKASATATPTPNPSRTPTVTPEPPQSAAASEATANVPFDDGDLLEETAVCGIVPSGWQSYAVEPGDTLFSLAQQRGSSIALIRQANCLYGELKAFTLIWLPPVISPAVIEPTPPA